MEGRGLPELPRPQSSASSTAHYLIERAYFAADWIRATNNSTRAYRAASLSLGPTASQQERSLLDILMQHDDDKMQPPLIQHNTAAHSNCENYLSALFQTTPNISKDKEVVPPPVPVRLPPAPERSRVPLPVRAVPPPPPRTRPGVPPTPPRDSYGQGLNAQLTPSLNNAQHHNESESSATLRQTIKLPVEKDTHKQPPPRPQAPSYSKRNPESFAPVPPKRKNIKIPPPLQTQLLQEEESQILHIFHQNESINGSSSKISMRQDSNVSSDSFSQSSSPSYTTKSMETPLLGQHSKKSKNKYIDSEKRKKERQMGDSDDTMSRLDDSSQALTKSHSTPASLQAIVRFHQGSSMTIHQRIINDIRRPSAHYITQGRLRLQYAQVIINAIVLLAIAGGLAAYFQGDTALLFEGNNWDEALRKRGAGAAHCQTAVRPESTDGERRLRLHMAVSLRAAGDPVDLTLRLHTCGGAANCQSYPSAVRYVNRTTTEQVVAIVPLEDVNPAPGICLPVIVTFCLQHKIPYNYTMFPNYIGHFTQRDAQQELEVYDAVVDVRCYKLAALFLCSVFVPKCGPLGQLVRPCRNLCSETKRRCGFFLDVFGLTLPEYLDCDLFPESEDSDVCVGHREVVDAEMRARMPVCLSGFQCDKKRCIPADWHCDGHVDCEDQSDELDCHQCAKGMIHCGSRTCVDQTHFCDGIRDCPWGQDERNCIRLSERMGDESKGKLEVFQPNLQSWKPTCLTSWDSVTSPKAICSMLGYKDVNSSNLAYKGSASGSKHLIKYSSHTWKRYSSPKRNINLLKQLRDCNTETFAPIELICSNFACGIRRQLVNQRKVTRIVGGTESSPGDWPFLAALLGGPEQIFYCAGVLVSDQWVLTASHCVGNSTHGDLSGWTIQLGMTRRHSHSYFGQKIKVKRVVPHPMYNQGVAHDNDVALFQLVSKVSFHEHLLPVCLPPANYKLKEKTLCTVIGWGKREDSGVSEYEPAVNEVQVPVVSRELCNSWLEHRDLNVTDGMICAGYAEGGKDACQGDSGGPLLCQLEEQPHRWFVGGIVSWGIKCAHPHLPGVYAYVPKYVPWIKQQMVLYDDK